MNIKTFKHAKIPMQNTGKWKFSDIIHVLGEAQTDDKFLYLKFGCIGQIPNLPNLSIHFFPNDYIALFLYIGKIVFIPNLLSKYSNNFISIILL